MGLVLEGQSLVEVYMTGIEEFGQTRFSCSLFVVALFFLSSALFFLSSALF